MNQPNWSKKGPRLKQPKDPSIPTTQKITQYFTQTTRKPYRPPTRKLNTLPPSRTEKIKSLQTTLTGFKITPSEGRKGDAFRLKKPPHTFRFMSANHNNLPTESYKQKSKLHISTINCYNPDVVAAQETGLNFFALEAHDSMEERICFLHEARVTYAHNQWEGTFCKHQPGGTMLISTNEATRRTTTSSDPPGLGRWATILLSGKEGHRTRIVSVYNPVASFPGPHTVNRQQRRHLRATKDYRKPTDALREDLKKRCLLGSKQENT